MKKRLTVSAGILAACFGIVLAVLAMVPPHTGVTKANFNRIEVGMASAEVDAIFGEGGNDWTSSVLRDVKKPPPRRRARAMLSWTANDGSLITVVFENDCVAAKNWLDSNETVYQRVRRLIRWPWW